MTSAIRARREAEDGFTLIELLVVVIIIGILAAIAIPAFLNQRERAWQAELTSSVRNVALDAEAEATTFGGDYTRVGDPSPTDPTGATQAELDTWINTALTGLQTASGPVTYTAGDSEATTTGFAVCMTHTQIESSGTPAGSIEYDTSLGGLQQFVETDCPAAVAVG